MAVDDIIEIMAKIRKVILLVESSSGYGRNLLVGISQYSRLNGPWRFFFRSGTHYHHKLNERKKLWNYMKSWKADGIIIREPKKDDEILKWGLPTIISPFKKELASFPAIVTDCVRTAKLAAEHFLDRGFRNFAYCGYDDMEWSQNRGKSFIEHIAKAGFHTYVYEQPRDLNYFYVNEQTSLIKWLKSLPKPVALFACNDDRGYEITQACRFGGLHVPEEIAVLGVDNDTVVCGFSDPPLSSIPLNSEKAGYEAAELLDRMMNGEKMAGQRIIDRPEQVIPRRSTDILAIEDSLVADAMRFIHEHSKELIQVRDVAEALAVTRQTLRSRFLKALGRTMFDEIKRTRIRQIEQLLLETNLSVSRIASNLGYLSSDHIARYFQSVKKMTPQQYRRKFISYL